MEVNIIKFDHFGRGIGKLNNKIVFVDKALPNDKKKYCEAKINRIIKKSNNRIKPICTFSNKCGGCNFLHTNYIKEKEFKMNKARQLLGRCDSFYETKEFNYRNKVTLHVKNNKMGLYKEKTNDIIDIDYCYLLNNNINRVISDLKTIDLNKYNFKTIIIKTNLNRILLNVDNIVNDDFINKFNYVNTIISKKKIVKGIGFIEEEINNKIFKITSEAFFQIYKEGIEKIYYIIINFLKDKKINRVLDLYSGTSLWGILISDSVKEITGIEINKEATICANDNIKRNSISNIMVINTDVKNYINKCKNIDLVIVDPPRSGLDKKTKEYLKRINSKNIIYISCNMITLKRDLDELKSNYDIVSINLVDMFEKTYHCESICLLERK